MIALHPALGCWALVAVRGHSPYLPGTVRARLDTALVSPDDTEALMTVTIDSATIRRIVGDGRIFIAQWGPYKRGDRIFLFWGNGFTGLDMRLRLKGDVVEGPSAETTDFGLDRDGPDVRGHRVSCGESNR